MVFIWKCDRKKKSVNDIFWNQKFWQKCRINHWKNNNNTNLTWMSYIYSLRIEISHFPFEFRFMFFLIRKNSLFLDWTKTFVWDKIVLILTSSGYFWNSWPLLSRFTMNYDTSHDMSLALMPAIRFRNKFFLVFFLFLMFSDWLCSMAFRWLLKSIGSLPTERAHYRISFN